MSHLYFMPQETTRMKSATEFVQEIIRSSTTLKLEQTVRFRRRTRSHPTTFDDFLESLKQNTTVRSVVVYGQLSYGLTQAEWLQTIATLGEIPHLQSLTFQGDRGPNVISLTALTRALQQQRAADTATSTHLTKLHLGSGVILYGSLEDSQDFCRVLSGSHLQELIWAAQLRLRRDGFGGDDRPLPLSSSLNLLFEQGLTNSTHLQTVEIRTEATLPTSALAIQHFWMHHQNANLQRLSLKTQHWGTVGAALQSRSELGNSFAALMSLHLSAFTVEPSECRQFLLSLKNSSTPFLQKVSLNMGAGWTDDAALALYEALRDPTQTSIRFVEWTDHDEYLPKLQGLSCQQGLPALIRLVQSNHVLQLTVYDDLTIVDHNNDSDDENNNQKKKHSNRDGNGKWTLIYQLKLENWLNQAGRARITTCRRRSHTGTDRNAAQDWLDIYITLAINDADHELFLQDSLYEITRIDPSIWLSGLK